MPGRCNLGVLLPQFYGQLRVTFEADAPAVFRKVQDGKNPYGLKYQGRVIEWEAFGDARFGDAVFTDFFNVH